MKLNSKDKTAFTDKGVLHLKGLIPGSKLGPARESILRELARLHLRENGKWHTKQLDGILPFQVTAKIAQRIRHQDSFNDVIPKELTNYMSDLAGLKLVPAQPYPQILVTPPQKQVWSVPHLGWHLDVASPSRDEIPGVQAFVLLDDVAPRGGGTVVVAGSHRLHGVKGSTAISAHQALQEDPFYATLFSAEVADRSGFLSPRLVRGVEVQIIEMCGKAGDVYLMDMRILHAPAVNASTKARMMLTSRYLNSSHL